MSKRIDRTIVGIAVALSLGSAVIMVTQPTLRPLPSTYLNAGPMQSCAARNATIAVLARVRPGHTLDELGTGYGWTASSEPGLYVVKTSSAMADPLGLRGSPSVLAAGYLFASTSDPSLRSCNYRLADNPRALSTFTTLEPALITSGLITRAQIADPSTIMIITDDPTDSRHLFVAAVISSPLTSSNQGSLESVVATVDKMSLRVLSVGLGHWYS